MDGAFFLPELSCNCLALIGPERGRERKEKRRGQNVHYIPLFQSTGLSAPHKDLDLWPLWASVHDSRATEPPDPIYLFVVCVGVVVACAHVGVYIKCAFNVCMCVQVEPVSPVQCVAIVFHMVMTKQIHSPLVGHTKLTFHTSKTLIIHGEG